MCGLGVVACGAPVDWELPACPGTPADGFVPRLALHAHAELSRPVPASHLAARGPDGARTLTLTAGVATAAIHVTASVLGIRGSAPALQPLVSTVTGDMLSFNGEVFRYDNDDDDDSNVSGAVVAGDEADSHALLRALERAPSPGTVLARVHGPWALCYWRASSATLYFGRDAIGRRSLLVARTARGLALCSVAVPLGALCGAEGAEDPADARALAADWQELPPLPAGGLWQLTLARAAGAGAGAGGSAARFVVRACLPRLAPACALRPPAARLRDSVRADEAPALAPSLPSGRANGAACFQPSLTQPPPAAEPRSKPPPITCADAARTALHAALSEAVRARVQLIGAAADAPAAARGAGAPGAEGARAASAAPAPAARVAVLFSGGIDSMVLAALAHEHCAAGMPIELVNVAFKPDSPGAACESPGTERSAAVAASAPAPAPAVAAADGGRADAEAGAQPRAAKPQPVPQPAAQRSAQASLAPDRISALHGLRELRAMAPARAWRLVLVDVSVGALSAARPRIEALIAPAETVMDLNIGAALFFGARGVGRLCDPPRGAELRGVEATAAEAADGVALTGGTALSARAALCRYAADAGADAAAAELAAADAGANAGADADAGAGAGHGQPYECTARVLLLGTGADEQLAGYGRHRTAFAARGAEALKFELLRDVTRLWVRNLGRDDRAMADAGREPRHPFLDERVLEVVARCAAGTLFDLSLPVGVGDKRALREIGLLLGLSASTRLQKRAIQFGTRLANKKVAGEARLSDALATADLVYHGDGAPQPQLGKDVRKQRGGGKRPPAAVADEVGVCAAAHHQLPAAVQ